MTPSHDEIVEALRESLRDRERLREQHRLLVAKDAEPIAIVGMSCRFPGGVRSPEDLWRLVASETDAISEFPDDRGWDLDRLYDPDPDTRGAVYTRHGGFVDGIADFDADFFGISPREALAMDPHQRVLLELAWAAIEHAGIDPMSLAGTRAGVFVGSGASEYAGRRAADLEGYRMAGTLGSVISGRVAYTLGLEGPALTVDTACSSSLVATHLACQALRRDEASLALAAGVMVMCTPWMLVEFSRQRGLATDGRCKAFAERADGTGLSEGAGVLVLERLSEARRHGHRVLAVITGSAVNQDGASNGLTAPNGPSQERVIRAALASAGLTPADVDAVEAHGTGTTLGDPIEAQALLATYGQARAGGPLHVGSFKSNIGHAQAAAGVGGVIKTVMALQHGLLPRTLHVDQLTSQVEWTDGDVEVLTEAQPWPRGERPRRAGVSSFGVSGTNVHLIVEEAPEVDEQAPAAASAKGPSAMVWPLSARTDAALRSQARQLREHLQDRPDVRPLDVAFELATGRAHLERRATIVGSDRDALLEALAALARGEQPGSIVAGTVRRGKTAFMFSGQGAQRPRMGAELYESFPAFRDALDEVFAELDRHTSRPLRELLFAEPGSGEAALLDRTEFTQPALFAVEVALFRLVESLGITPDFLTGHSVGELAAAHVAGVLSLPDACELVAARGRLIDALPDGGGMLAVAGGEDEVAECLGGFGGRLSLAAVNAPHAVVVSGAGGALDEFESEWAQRGRDTKRLRVSHAFHSARMDPMLEEFRAVANRVTFGAPRIPIVSSVHGGRAAEEISSPDYWVRHVRETVRFADAVAALDRAGVTRYLELGPDGVLVGMAAASLDADERVLLAPALRARHPDGEAFAAFVAAAHAAGVAIDWQALFEGRGARRVDLPTYAFAGKRYWLTEQAGDGLGSADPALGGHPMLTSMVPLARGDEWLFTGRLSVPTHAWIASHVLAGTVVLPGTAFVDLALTAGAALDCDVVEELTLEAPLLPPGDREVELQLLVEAAEAGRRQFTIHSRASGGEWITNATGTLATAVDAATELEALGAEPWPPDAADEVDVDSIVERMAEIAGFDYGPAFLGVNAAWRRGDAIVSEVELADEYAGESGRYALHPALLDMALHAGCALLTGEADLAPGQGRMLFRWANARLHARGASRLRVLARPAGTDAISFAVLADDGRPVLSVEAVSARAVDVEQIRAAITSERQSLYRVEWPAVELPERGEEPTVATIGEAGYADLAALVAALDAGAAAPEVVVSAVSGGGADTAERARAAAAETVVLLQGWLAETRLSDSRLVLVTRGAVAAGGGEVPDPALAAVWSLVGSAQSEHPASFVLVDRDADDDLPWGRLAAGPEPQVAVRAGEFRAPRLMTVTAASGEPVAWDAEGTVLLTGATGGLGAVVAGHLADRGVHHMILVSRRGPDAEGAGELIAALRARGCEARLVACDVSDRSALEALIASIEHRVTAVVHMAGVLDDATIASTSAEQVERVMRAKADAALHLYELTESLDLAAFVLFSSAAGVMGAPGQGTYAAANAVLDALAHRGRAAGRVVTSLAWGPWERDGGMADAIGEADRARMERVGMRPLSPELGLEQFDAALASGQPVLVAARLEIATLRARAREGALPAVLGGLVPASARRARGSGGSLARRLAELPEERWEEAVLELLRREVATVLGHESPDAVDADRSFTELGFDSLSAVELRNRLGQTTGLRLPATLVFDYPTVTAAAGFLRSQVAGAEHRRAVARRASLDEPIAIVGMSCRYPGGASSPEALWELVASGRDAIGDFPTDRGWDLERLYDPDPDTPGTCYVRSGGFLYDAADFDARFFGIGPGEAMAMDPQQRLLLEAAWDAFESAGIDAASLRDTNTGVFVGAVASDYRKRVRAEHEPFRLTGTTMSVVSGRVAYTFGLQGPALTIDTACSSSLVALHTACQSLRDGGCSLALAGGVTVMESPDLYVDFARQRGLASDGRCKSYGASADGTGFSEGLGVLVLERLSDARRHGHRVLATVRGSAVNQDGASNGLTAPNGPSQERVIEAALASAGLSPADVDAVEGHGTGTMLGDPIEAQVLIAAYGRERSNGPLYLGSIKSNIGHTSAAAGVAGVIKMVQAMRHGLLPPSLHCEQPTPHVDWSAGAVQLLHDPVRWEPSERPRRAGVSSFGVSGTNVHVILEEAPVEAPTKEPASPLPVLPLLVSGRSEAALRAQAERLRRWLVERPELELLDVAFSLAPARARLEWRGAVLGSGRDELVARLEALARGERAGSVVFDRARSGKTAFLFTGQGAQWSGMGAQLYRELPVVAEALDAVCAELDPRLGRPLTELLFAEAGSPEDELLGRTEFTQAALFAVEVALYRQFEAWGVRPDFLVGHSIGELVAAHVAGVLSLADACTLVAARGRLMGALPDGGAMVALEACEDEVAASLEQVHGVVSIAAVNGPRAVVVSGAREAVERCQALWRERGRKTSRLQVSHAFHSPLIEPMLDDLRTVAEGLRFEPPQIAIVSNLSGGVVSEEVCDADYWVRHVRDAVRFADGVRELERLGVTRFVELGPDGVLSALARDCVSEELEQRGLFTPALRPRRDQVRTLVGCVAAMHAAGIDVDWRSVLAVSDARLVDLPTYAFQRERYWLDGAADGGDLTAAGHRTIDHPILAAGMRIAATDEWVFTGSLSRARHPWIADHSVLDTVVLPGTAFVEIALAAGEAIGCDLVHELNLEAPLALGEHEGALIQVRIEAPDRWGRRAVAIHSRPDSEDQDWTRHASGAVAPGAEPRHSALTERLAAEQWPPEGAEELDVELMYDRLFQLGMTYGRSFMGVRRAWRRADELFAEVTLDDDNAAEADRYGIHPAVLDAALQGGMELAYPDDGAARMVFQWEGVRRHAGHGTSLRVGLTAGEGTVAIAAVDESGAGVASVDAVAVRPVDAERLALARRDTDDGRFRLEWVELPVPSNNGRRPRFALLGDIDAGSLGERHRDPQALVDAIDAGTEPPDLVLAPAPRGPARAVVCRTLELLQTWLADERLSNARLVLVTRGAVATHAGEAPDAAAAALWGLVRSAQSEHPGRFALLDTDGAEASWHAASILLPAGESQLALRDGVGRVPRIARAAGPAASPEPPFDPDGTVLITGGTSGLGALVARHLAAEHGVRHLLLASRRGPRVPGARELQAELERLGATPILAACDVSERDQVSALIDSVCPEHPLRAVIHAAGVLDDGLVESLTGEQVDRVLCPKVDGALHLHELTAGLELTRFVTFSSFAATAGTPGQANYAAANAFLDALVACRRAGGLPGQSLVWTAWAQSGGMTGDRDAADKARIQRLGARLLTDDEGLALFDAALRSDEPLALLARLDTTALRSMARDGRLPPILSGLVPARPRRTSDTTDRLERRLSGVAEPERSQIVVDLVRDHVAAVLALESREAVDPELAFTEMGFDSLSAVDLRNQLTSSTGARLPATLVFDHPTPQAVAALVLDQLTGASPAPSSRDVAPANPGGTLLSLLRQARDRDSLIEFGRMLAAASKFRPAFGSAADLERPPSVVSLSRGEPTQLICIPSFVGGFGPHQFARLASSFSVSAVSLPGFGPGERVPATLNAAVDALAASVREAAADGPLVLVGYSIGGVLAHALARRLEDEGVSPAGLVMLDTLPPESPEERSAVFGAVMATVRDKVPLDDANLLAMGTYIRLLEEWEPQWIETPSLLVRADEPLAVQNGSPLWWQERCDVVRVAGNHFALIDEAASETAGVIDEWVRETATRHATPARADR